jgi:hypothetical protein
MISDEMTEKMKLTILKFVPINSLLLKLLHPIVHIRVLPAAKSGHCVHILYTHTSSYRTCERGTDTIAIFVLLCHLTFPMN